MDTPPPRDRMPPRRNRSVDPPRPPPRTLSIAEDRTLTGELESRLSALKRELGCQARSAHCVFGPFFLSLILHARRSGGAAVCLPQMARVNLCMWDGGCGQALKRA